VGFISDLHVARNLDDSIPLVPLETGLSPTSGNEVAAPALAQIEVLRSNTSGPTHVDNQVNELKELLASLSLRIATMESTLATTGQSPQPGHSPRTERRPRVKISPWRALNSLLVLGLGAYKAIETYRGQTIAPTTADWIIGVLWALVYVHTLHPHGELSY
jgi:hypothetical protein